DRGLEFDPPGPDHLDRRRQGRAKRKADFELEQVARLPVPAGEDAHAPDADVEEAMEDLRPRRGQPRWRVEARVAPAVSVAPECAHAPPALANSRVLIPASARPLKSGRRSWWMRLIRLSLR